MTANLDGVRVAALELLHKQTARKAQELRNAIVEELSTEGRGRSYRRGRTAVHVASAAGDAPAVDTGRLRQSITALKVDDGHWRVGTNVVYAPYLEFGTRRMAARPFMRVAVRKVFGE